MVAFHLLPDISGCLTLKLAYCTMFDTLLLKRLYFYYGGKVILKLKKNEKLFTAYKYLILGGIYLIK
jgi:hypothetical protein